MKGILICIFLFSLYIGINAETTCATFPFGEVPSLFTTWTLGNFSLVPLVGKNSGSDVEGRLAVGGWAEIHNSIGQNMTNWTCTALRAAGEYENVLVVRRRLQFAPEGGIKGGNVVVGDNTSYINYARTTFSANCTVIVNSSAIDFEYWHDHLKNLSTSLATYPATGTVRWAPAGYQFIGSGAEIEVFNVPNGTLFLQSRVPRLSGISPTVKLILFNVFGNKTGFSRVDMRDFVATFKTNLFNFPEAHTLTAEFTGIQGTILAPWANIPNSEGVVWGQMFLNSHYGNMQQNLPRFSGCIPVSNCSEKCPGVGCRSSEPTCGSIQTGNPCSYFVCDAIFGKRSNIMTRQDRAETIPSECVEVAQLFGTTCNKTDTDCVTGVCDFAGICRAVENTCAPPSATTSAPVNATTEAPTTQAPTTQPPTLTPTTQPAPTVPQSTVSNGLAKTVCFEYILSDGALTCEVGAKKRSTAPSIEFSIPQNPTLTADQVPTDGNLVAVFTMPDITGAYDARQSVPRLDLIANGYLGQQAFQVRLSYDFDGDGRWDRYEIWGIKDLDNDNSTWENYREVYTVPYFVSGADYQNFVNGVLRVEIWQVISRNEGYVVMLTGGPSQKYSGQYSMITMPFSQLDENSQSVVSSETLAIAEWAIVVVVLAAVASCALITFLVYRVFVRGRKNEGKLSFQAEDPSQAKARKEQELQQQEQAAVDELNKQKREQQQTQEESQQDSSEEFAMQENISFKPNSKQATQIEA